MITIVKNNWKLIIGIILVIIVVSSYLFSTSNLQTVSTIPDILEQENKELLARNTALNSKILDLKLSAESLQEIINGKDQQIYHLKLALDEKVNRINNFSILELERFFSRLKADSLPH